MKILSSSENLRLMREIAKKTGTECEVYYGANSTPLDAINASTNLVIKKSSDAEIKAFQDLVIANQIFRDDYEVFGTVQPDFQKKIGETSLRIIVSVLIRNPEACQQLSIDIKKDIENRVALFQEKINQRMAS